MPFLNALFTSIKILHLAFRRPNTEKKPKMSGEEPQIVENAPTDQGKKKGEEAEEPKENQGKKKGEEAEERNENEGMKKGDEEEERKDNEGMKKKDGRKRRGKHNRRGGF